MNGFSRVDVPSVPDAAPHSPDIQLALTSEGLLGRLGSYLPEARLLQEFNKPSSIDEARRDVFRRTYPNCDYAAVSHDGKMIMVPAWHPLNTMPMITHTTDYGSGVFEGGSAEPVIENGKVVGANVILLQPKMQRMFGRSLPERNLRLDHTPQSFAQTTLDLVAAHGSSLYLGNHGPKRAYIRPVGRPSFKAGLGVRAKLNAPTDAAIEVFYWPFYLARDPDDAYNGKGAVAVALPEQRLQPITGKHASNYGPAGTLTDRAKSQNADEAVIFAPFTSRSGNKGETINLHQDYVVEGRDVFDILYDLSFADGPGEEIAAVVDGELWVLPMRVNRLGGTTLQHVQRYIAPHVGLTVVQRTFSLNELADAQREGKTVTPMYIGNAIRICPIGQIDVRDYKLNLRETLGFDVSSEVRQIQALYEGQVAGKFDSGNPQLLTSVNLIEGNEARARLDEVYARWFEPEYLEQVHNFK